MCMSITLHMAKPSFSLHCESSSIPKHCLEDPVQLYSCLDCDSLEASGIASDTVRLPNACSLFAVGEISWPSTAGGLK